MILFKFFAIVIFITFILYKTNIDNNYFEILKDRFITKIHNFDINKFIDKTKNEMNQEFNKIQDKNVVEKVKEIEIKNVDFKDNLNGDVKLSLNLETKTIKKFIFSNNQWIPID